MLESILEARAILLRDERRRDGNAREITGHCKRSSAWLVVNNDHRQRPHCLRTHRLVSERASSTVDDHDAALHRLGVVPDGLAAVSRHSADERRADAVGHLKREARLCARVHGARTVCAEDDLRLGARLQLACKQ